MAPPCAAVSTAMAEPAPAPGIARQEKEPNGSSDFPFRAFHGHVVARHHVVDELLEILPRRLAEVVVADDERGAGVELLVLQVPAGELRADQVPCELVELHAVEGRKLRRLPVLLEERTHLGIV